MTWSVQTKLYVWLSVTLAVALALMFTKRRSRQSLPPESQWLGLPLSTLGTLVGLQNIFQALTIAELQAILDVDGSVALVIGGACTIYLSGKEIWKLFQSQTSAP
jgi:hypothetical protein